jgi:hypothetical protein
MPAVRLSFNFYETVLALRKRYSSVRKEITLFVS